jgi:hypothetical protein
MRLVQTINAGFKRLIALFGGQLNSEQVESFVKVFDVVEPAKEALAHPTFIASKLGLNDRNYQLWTSKHELNKHDIHSIKQEIEAAPHKPTLSIVLPVFHLDETCLLSTINSVLNQLYPFWQLCLLNNTQSSDDALPTLKRLAAVDERIFVCPNNNPDINIAVAFKHATGLLKGDYIGFLGACDELSVNALFERSTYPLKSDLSIVTKIRLRWINVVLDRFLIQITHPTYWIRRTTFATLQ